MRKMIPGRLALMMAGLLSLVLVAGLRPTALAQGFVHPGLLNTEADFARMRTKVD